VLDVVDTDFGYLVVLEEPMKMEYVGYSSRKVETPNRVAMNVNV
jgi:Txe/YoeB family toxin of Txe-Axe toxin-antitoxin module